ncbi:DUF1289 domain-containing protein [Methylocystis heyeri]|uniref:DUF1289 domain-containing protein n=1 Tax=Methylocystis heyeri TaxID=391905 RepID=A0A6B8KJ49_9HYPH|nr:DUF1289 domain-containing protein [Methylocystis heyeri]QGM47539.1 DUF1289 domain-containing protein [Methylocystis heyeri]
MTASPCIGVCQIEPSSGLCLGCARSLQEIGRWRDASELERKRISAELPARKARLPEPPAQGRVTQRRS